MRSDSLNIIPSFDSIPQIPKAYPVYSQQMKLIVSEIQIKSFKFLDDHAQNNDQLREQDQELSIQHFQEDKQHKNQNQEAVCGTIASFKTPKKKKKNGCVCKKTGCLKLYCECFSLGRMCTQECSCCDCSNIPENNKEVQSARIIRKNRCKHVPEKKICNCKKSQCQKKYCECYNAGVACNAQCKCQGCGNRQEESSQNLICN